MELNKEDEFEANEEILKQIHSRTPEEIEDILKLANINPSNVASIVQSLYTLKPLNTDDNSFQVLELDKHLLDSLKVGDCLSFRGDEKEPAVLCSATKTYEVKEAETSNTCLIVPNLKSHKQILEEGLENCCIQAVEIEGTFNTYLEVRECSPKLSKLQIVLEPSSFKGLEYEQSIDQSLLYDWNKLQSEIQASDSEILSALPENLIALMDGHYRLIAFEFEARAVPLMLDLIEENSWEIDEIDKEVSYESLEEIIPRPVFDLLFQKYTEKSTKTKEDGTQLYKYKEATSSRLLAQILLSTCPVNKYDDFMEAWKIGSPDSIPPKKEYLYGVAIATWNSQSARKEVVYYPESNLPDNIIKRLNELFKMKEKWTVPEITPYILRFATEKQNVNAILTKYARASTIRNVKYYSAKHGK